jgi:hypothetical protein
MDLVNDLSSDVALAVFVEGNLRQKLNAEDAKSFIELVEAELSRIENEEGEAEERYLPAVLSH